MFEAQSWKGSIEKGPEKGRGIDDYERFLAFDRKSLEGKKILDLGAGPGARFARDVKAAGIKAEVISLSPDYADKKQQKLLELTPKERIKELIRMEKTDPLLAVAGVGEALPFADESFDEVLSLFSLTTYSMKNYAIWLSETIRVLKSGGTLRIGPFERTWVDYFNPSDPEHSIREREELKAFVDKFGFDSEFITEKESRKEVLILKKSLKEGNFPEASEV